MKKFILKIVLLLMMQQGWGQSALELMRNDKIITRPATGWTLKPVNQLSWKTFEVKFHILGETNMTRPVVNQETVNQCLMVLNTNFNQARISFTTCENAGFAWVTDYKIITQANKTVAENYLISNYGNPTKINIYIVDRIDLKDDGYPVAGYAALPTSSQNLIVIDKESCLDCTLTHEMGHFLGLMHTHEDSFGKEHVDGTNCSTTGDLLCDTKADPKILVTETEMIDEKRQHIAPWWRYYNDRFPKNSEKKGVFHPYPVPTTTGGNLTSGFIAIGKCSIDELSVDIFNNVNTPSKCNNPSEWTFFGYNITQLENNQLDYTQLDNILNYIIDTRGVRADEHVYDIGNPNIYWMVGEMALSPNNVYCQNKPFNQQPPWPKLVNFNGCWKNCEYNGTVRDPKGQLYTPPQENYMSYAPCNCVSLFTPEQINEMHYWSTTQYRTPFQNVTTTNLGGSPNVVSTIYTQSTKKVDDNIVLKNVTITNNAKIELDHCNTTTIYGNFNMSLGTTLFIH
jgi:hypothetical protein